MGEEKKREGEGLSFSSENKKEFFIKNEFLAFPLFDLNNFLTNSCLG